MVLKQYVLRKIEPVVPVEDDLDDELDDDHDDEPEHDEHEDEVDDEHDEADQPRAGRTMRPTTTRSMTEPPIDDG